MCTALTGTPMCSPVYWTSEPLHQPHERRQLCRPDLSTHWGSRHPKALYPWVSVSIEKPICGSESPFSSCSLRPEPGSVNEASPHG